MICDALPAFRTAQPVELRRVDLRTHAQISLIQVSAIPVGRRDDNANRQSILLCENKVALVVGWHSHHYSRSVAQEHIVANENGHSLAVQLVDAV